MNEEKSLVSLLVALGRLGSISSRMRERAALTLAPFTSDPGLKRLLSIAAAALSGDLPGALEQAGEDPALVLEAAARLENALSEASRAVASRLAGLAEWAASRLLYYDASLLYVEAVRLRLEWEILSPLDRLSAVMLLEDIAGAEAREVAMLRSMLLGEGCFPRRYCPSTPPRSVEDARQLLGLARRAYEILSQLRLPSREALHERLVSKIEAPRLLEASKSVIGNIPGTVVVLRPEDLEEALDATVIVYDNERESLERAISKMPVIAVPAFKWSGASVEELWYSRHGGRISSRMRDEAVAAPLYSLVRAVHSGALSIGGRPPSVGLQDDVVLVVIESLGLEARIDAPRGVGELRKNLVEALAVPPGPDRFDGALARGVLRGLLSLGSPHEYGEAADS